VSAKPIGYRIDWEILSKGCEAGDKCLSLRKCRHPKTCPQQHLFIPIYPEGGES